MKKIYFIINPVSGTGSKEKIPFLIEQVFSSGLYQPEIIFTEYPGHASDLTRSAIEKKADIVVAVGGDGTVNEIAKSMIHSETALGIVPMGSGNGLARDLRIPLDSRKALEVIHKGNITSIDYCKANGHVFFCTCGVGFDAMVSERFSEGKLRGSISYVISVISEYLKFQPDNYTIMLDQETIKEKAFLITCANASQYGNNAYIAPHANIQDGKMDIAIISPINPLEAGPLAIQLFTKQIDKNNKLRSFQSRKVIIKRSKPGPMHIDGDPILAGKKITVATVPSGLRVVVPVKEDLQTPIQAQINDIQSFFREISNWIQEQAQISLPKL